VHYTVQISEEVFVATGVYIFTLLLEIFKNKNSIAVFYALKVK